MSTSFDDKIERAIKEFRIDDTAVEDFPYDLDTLRQAMSDWHEVGVRYSELGDDMPYSGWSSEEERQAYAEAEPQHYQRGITLVVKKSSAYLRRAEGNLVELYRRLSSETVKLTPKDLVINPSGSYAFTGTRERGGSSGYRRWDWTEIYTVSVSSSGEMSLHIEYKE